MHHFLKLPSLKRLVWLLLVFVPAVSWYVVRPVRVIAPKFAGVHCPTPQVCVDDLSRLAEASALGLEAEAFVSLSLGAALNAPRVIFCSTQACADAFGLKSRSAVTVGTLGTVIGPRAWHPHYLRHELIHQLQAQQLGVASLLFKPSWFVEGMAYSLSQDPRAVLAEPWQTDRSRFDAWYGALGKTNMWDAASRL